MKVRMEPITAIVISVLLGWGWYKVVDKPVCQVLEVHYGYEVLVPKYCEDVLEGEGEQE